jgi:hypothetical protein
MKNLSTGAKVYILGVILVGLGLLSWSLLVLTWGNLMLYVLAALGAVAQTLKVEGPNDKTNYNIAWFVYGFAFIALGPAAAVFVLLVSHLVEWAWHRYPWYIQSFNIGANVVALVLAGLLYESLAQGSMVLDLNGAIAMIAGLTLFVFLNHLFVGLVIKLARGQSLAESGVFEFFSLFLDFALLAMGAVTALVWFYNPFATILNVLPLYLLYNAIKVPALNRQVQEMESQMAQSGD